MSYVLAQLCAGWLLACVIQTTRGDEAEDKAAAALTKLGAVVERDKTKPDRPVVRVEPGDWRPADADMKWLRDLKQLRHLQLHVPLSGGFFFGAAGAQGGAASGPE